MDSEVILIMVVVLLVVWIVGCRFKNWFKARPDWATVAIAVLVVAGFLIVEDTPQFSAWLDCLSEYRVICIPGN